MSQGDVSNPACISKSFSKPAGAKSGIFECERVPHITCSVTMNVQRGGTREQMSALFEAVCIMWA